MKLPKLSRKLENRLRERFRREELRKLERQNVDPIKSPIIDAIREVDIKRSINAMSEEEILKLEAKLFDGKDYDLKYR